MKSLISVFSFLLLFSTQLLAQPQLKLSALRYDFGSILWKHPAKALFSITNSGNSDLIIQDVHPDCGCTVAEWTQESIQPGETGQIIVTYDAELLGRFNKQLGVTTNENPLPFYLTVSGDVVMEKKDYSKEYPYRIGDIYLDTDNVEFEEVQKGEFPFKTITIFNAGRQSYKPQLMHLPKYLKAESEPEVVSPGEQGFLNIILNSELLREMGLNQTSIYLSRFPGDRISHDNEILCSAILLPELQLSEKEQQNAPKIKVDSTLLYLGNFAGKDHLKGKIVIENTGHSDLIISALQVYNPGISAKMGKSRLKPGAKTTLKITLYADRHHFKGRRRVLLITNDPQHPKVSIDIRVKK